LTLTRGPLLYDAVTSDAVATVADATGVVRPAFTLPPTTLTGEIFVVSLCMFFKYSCGNALFAFY
jgi:hypothetical protein